MRKCKESVPHLIGWYPHGRETYVNIIQELELGLIVEERTAVRAIVALHV